MFVVDSYRADADEEKKTDYRKMREIELHLHFPRTKKLKSFSLSFILFPSQSYQYYKAMKDHYESKHPKETCPPEDSFVKVK